MLTLSITETTSRDSFNLDYNRNTTDYGQQQRGAGIVLVVSKSLVFFYQLYLVEKGLFKNISANNEAMLLKLDRDVAPTKYTRWYTF